MIFILLLLLLSSLFIIQIDSTFLTYTLYPTDDICQENWQGSICLPIFSLDYFDQPLTIQVPWNDENFCQSQMLVYIRTKQCIYCSKTPHVDIHCQHRRIRRMTSTNKESLHRNSFAIIAISLLALLVIGTLFTLLIIKRSQAHTNLLELLQPNSNIQSIKVPNKIKSKPMHLTVPQPIRPMK